MSSAMDELEARVNQQLHRIRQLSEDMGRVRVRETSADGVVTVEVDGSGALLDLAFTSAVSKLSPGEFESLVVTTAQRAAHRAFAERAEVITDFNEEVAETTSTVHRDG